MISPGTLNLIVFLALAAFGVLAWFGIRRNIRGIDFEDVPSGAGLRPGSGNPGEEPPADSREPGPRQ